MSKETYRTIRVLQGAVISLLLGYLLMVTVDIKADLDRVAKVADAAQGLK